MSRSIVACKILFLLVVSLPAYSQDIYNIDFELILAAESGDSAGVSQLISLGADVNATTYDGVTPLMYASQHGYNNIIEKLIKHGADPDMQPSNGNTALISASVPAGMKPLN